jgi:hypothetical protein
MQAGPDQGEAAPELFTFQPDLDFTICHRLLHRSLFAWRLICPQV